MTKKKEVELDEDDPLYDPPKVVQFRKKEAPRQCQRLIGCPMDLLADTWRLTPSRTAMIVVMHIYRRMKVCRAETVTLSGEELAELGINSRERSRALFRLREVGLVRTKEGRSLKSSLRVSLTRRRCSVTEEGRA